MEAHETRNESSPWLQSSGLTGFTVIHKLVEYEAAAEQGPRTQFMSQTI